MKTYTIRTHRNLEVAAFDLGNYCIWRWLTRTASFALLLLLVTMSGGCGEGKSGESAVVTNEAAFPGGEPWVIRGNLRAGAHPDRSSLSMYYYHACAGGASQNKWEYLCKAWDEGSKEALYELIKEPGYLELQGRYELALRLAKTGDALGMYYTGEMLRMNVLGPPDYAAAYKWFTEAAKQTNDHYGPLAMCNIGWMHGHGEGRSKDPRKAVAWCRKAAAAGESEGMWYLGMAYEDGVGVSKNLTEAAKWCARGSTLGNYRCREWLTALRSNYPAEFGTVAAQETEAGENKAEWEARLKQMQIDSVERKRQREGRGDYNPNYHD